MKTLPLLGVLGWIVTIAGSAFAQTWTMLNTTGTPPDDYSQVVANYDRGNNRLIVYFASNPSVPPNHDTEV